MNVERNELFEIVNNFGYQLYYFENFNNFEKIEKEI